MSRLLHGGRLDQAIKQYGGGRGDWLDLSTGINPVPYPVPQLPYETWHRLPDDGAEAGLLAVAREYYRVPDGVGILAAPGTQALIQLLPRMFGSDAVEIVSPTYGEHAEVWEHAGSAVRRVEDLASARGGGGITVVVNPNNPDARLYPPDLLIHLARGQQAVIVDEAFADPVDEASLVPELPDNAIVLKSFGKFFGLAGLRLGFMIAKPEWVEQIRAALGPWAVSGPAITIGTVALADQAWCDQTRLRLERDSVMLADVLEKAGFGIVGINPLFVYARHAQAREIAERLAGNHILVRQFPDRPDYLRFGICRDQPALDRLQSGLEKALDA